MSYAFTIHSLIDRQLDIMTSNQETIDITEIPEDMKAYIKWFSKQMEATGHEFLLPSSGGFDSENHTASQGQ